MVLWGLLSAQGHTLSGGLIHCLLRDARLLWTLNWASSPPQLLLLLLSSAALKIAPT